MTKPNCSKRPAAAPGLLSDAAEPGDESFDFEDDLDFTVPAPAPKSATTTLPGSPEKIAILAARAAMAEELHHSGDVMCRVAGVLGDVDGERKLGLSDGRKRTTAADRQRVKERERKLEELNQWAGARARMDPSPVDPEFDDDAEVDADFNSDLESFDRHPSPCEDWFPAFLSLVKQVANIRYVCWEPTKRLWRVRPWLDDPITGKRRRINLGCFQTEEEGIAALLKWQAERGEGVTLGEAQWCDINSEVDAEPTVDRPCDEAMRCVPAARR